MRTCKTCANWEPEQNKRRATDVIRGRCKSAKLSDYVDETEEDGLTYSGGEEGDFMTGADFGCVHHTHHTVVHPNWRLAQS